MFQLSGRWRALIAVMLFAFTFSTIPVRIRAQQLTTGTISGVVTDAQTGAPIAGVVVTAKSGSDVGATMTDSRGFYTLQQLSVDTYTVSFDFKGYAPVSIPGVTAPQAVVTRLNEKLSKSLSVIANVSARSATNLVQPNQTSDTYNVSGQQLDAVSGGNELQKTLYQYVDTIPGITVNGFGTQPRIHGGSVTDEQYEFDGIPIRDRMTGFFTTNLSNIGVKNVEVSTGGISSESSDAGLGIINTVMKTGTYPGFGTVAYGTDITDRLTNFMAEYGGATKDHRWSWYLGMQKTGSLDQFANGNAYTAAIVEGYNGPGPVYTTDLIGNFHYRPNNKDDFQLLVQNGLGDFIYGYGFPRTNGAEPPLTAVPCPGYAVSATTPTGAAGGTAPNGQNCPAGLYFGTASGAGTGMGGNIWHHYSGIGKIQWNHIINDHSSFALRLAENFNEYIFDQPIVDDNNPAIENSPDFHPGNCPAYPYSPNTPIPVVNGQLCVEQDLFFNTGYEGDRRSEMWLGSFDYTNQISDNATIRAGIGQEYDNNLDNSYYTFYFNGDGSWPGVNSMSTYPDHVPSAYVNSSIREGKWLFEPGVRWQRMYYDYPESSIGAAGPYSVGIWNPTFAATYTMNNKNVIRGSWTDSTSFVGTAYVWREGSSVFNPGGEFSANPTIFHSGDLMWEHEFDPDTSIRIGPYWNKASNVFYEFRPVLSINNATGAVTYGPTQAANGGFRQSLGAEFGFTHVDRHPVGASYWLSATYDNFWTNITSALTGSYGASGLPSFLPVVRSPYDPLISASLVADIHADRWHFMPTVYYQGPSPYQTGECAAAQKWINLTGYPYYSTCASTSSNLQKPVGLLPELWSSGYWWSNATLAYDMGPKKNLRIGLQVTNLFNNQNPTIPCYSNVQKNTPALGAGCSPYYPLAGQQQLPSSGYVYQNTSQTPRQIMLFIQQKF
ncbi:MAG: TonB-dependent receptor [Candidatus Eremiobacteraeota bacterium]|nr:TonB-dependent receptor [Candidatus Eremiobacteraeota bacterium]